MVKGISVFLHFFFKHICETQLIGFTQEIEDSFDQGQQTDVIVMDFSKAFDKIDHHLTRSQTKTHGSKPIHHHID